MGGKLDVASSNGETSFYITLRRQSVMETSIDSIAQSGVRTVTLPVLGPRRTALVVDDESDILQVLEHKLRNVFDVSKTTSAMEASELLKTKRFDVLITDLKMPDLAGDALIRMARAIDQEILIVLISGHAAAIEVDLASLPGPKVIQIEKPLPDTQVFIQMILEATSAAKKAG